MDGGGHSGILYCIHMNNAATYDVAIAGGGLAGLCAAILLAQQGRKVILFEKERYPFHKVCGEYISLESYSLLQSIGFDPGPKDVPIIKKLFLSSPSGTHLTHDLPLGGFGISRYSLDAELADIAEAAGVRLMQETRVDEIERQEDGFLSKTSAGEFRSKLVCCAFGKRSNLDVKWKRAFTQVKPNAINNFIGVKYHAQVETAHDVIELHNFHDGYCGLSPIESGNSCICYLTTAQNLKISNNNIKQMEEGILYRNPHIKKLFAGAKLLYDKPLTISQVSFDNKQRHENGMLFLGDAASMIAPLCGNGMSMALHSGRIASECMQQFFEGRISLDALGQSYSAAWSKTFGSRMKAGRIIQRIFGSEWLSNTAIGITKVWPGLLTSIIRQTHGKPATGLNMARQ